MSPVVIRIPERGRTEITQTAWRQLSSASSFWELVEKGVISVERPNANRVCLVGNCYVGRAFIADDIIIEVHEKILGALAILLTHATRTSFNIEKLPAPASELGLLIGLLANQFVEVLRRYISRGREFVYSHKKRIGSLVGGKIDITGTIRLRARGLRHLIQFEKNMVVNNTPFNRIALAALREVDRLSRIMQIDQVVLAHARALAILFSDCRDTSVLFGVRADLVRLAQDLKMSSKDDTRRDLLALAILLISHESFEHGAATTSISPRAWFLNLETLFESAVRNTMDISARADVRVFAGRDAPMPVFATAAIKQYRANPDLVVRVGTSVKAVGDVKYKEMDKFPLASDVYQLIVHTTAFASSEAFLVYPGDTFSYFELGTSSAGPRVCIFTVDIRTLHVHMGRVLSIIGVPTAAPVSAGVATSQ